MRKKLFLAILIVFGVLILGSGIYFGFFYAKKLRQVKTENSKSTPSVSDIQTGAIYMENQAEIQELANKGESRYRDPVGAAQLEGIAYGFNANDTFTLVQNNYSQSEDTYLAEVRANHDGKNYIIALLQIAQPENNGIWLIAGIREEL